MLSRLDLRGAGTDVAALRARLPQGGEQTWGLGRAGGGGAGDPRRSSARGGDAALAELTERFDGVRLRSLRVPAGDVHAAVDAIPADAAAGARGRPGRTSSSTTSTKPSRDTANDRAGLVVRELRRAVDRAGLYVPGGRARYPSTVLMTAGPARVAGVEELALTVPPAADGRIPVETLAAAAIAEVDEVYARRRRPGDRRAGLRHRNRSAPSTSSSARATCTSPSPNGRSPARASSVCLRRLPGPQRSSSWPTHRFRPNGPPSTSWCKRSTDRVASPGSSPGIRRCSTMSPRPAPVSSRTHPRRADIESTLAAGGYAVLCDSPEQAIAVANAVAPEHLELLVADPEPLVPLVRHAGRGLHGPARHRRDRRLRRRPVPCASHVRLGPVLVSACGSRTSRR